MKCLCCGKEIKENTPDYKNARGWHKKCIRSFFMTDELPSLEINNEILTDIADRSVEKGYTVPGVQKKLSLHLSKEKDARLTVVDYPTGYILKPQTEDFAYLPEAEHLVMHMAVLAGINVVPNGLLRVADTYAYITKRVDRRITSRQVQMYAMEDFCQLKGHLTQDKYRGSYETCAKIIRDYSSRPGLDLSELFMRLIFCFISGNSDMHLKNFSLIESAPGSREYYLSAAYDLLPVNIIMPEDEEETALALNGKKRNLKRNDFLKFAESANIPLKTAERLMDRMISLENVFVQQIQESLLPDHMKKDMEELLKYRISKLKKTS